jgi:hypothetical protein
MEKPAEGEFDILNMAPAVVAPGLTKEERSKEKHVHSEHTRRHISVPLQETCMTLSQRYLKAHPSSSMLV